MLYKSQMIISWNIWNKNAKDELPLFIIEFDLNSNYSVIAFDSSSLRRCLCRSFEVV